MFFNVMTKPDMSSTPSLLISDPGSAVALGSKRVNSRLKFCLCLTRSGCSLKQRRHKSNFKKYSNQSTRNPVKKVPARNIDLTSFIFESINLGMFSRISTKTSASDSIIFKQ